MKVTHLQSGQQKNVIIELVTKKDYRFITVEKYHFDWEIEKVNTVYKLKFIDNDEILGLMSLEIYPAESRIEVVLLATSIENTGKNKIYDGIAGNLIAFACREAVKLFSELACVSLTPKTELKKYYIKKYGMLDAGRQVFLELDSLYNLLKKYAI